MRCAEAIEAGAYVLGALSPAERSAYQRHMAVCAQCRDEVTDLAGLPGLLGRLDEATAAGVTGPEPASASTTILTGVLEKVSAERGRIRRRFRLRATLLAAAAACVALLVGLLGGPAMINTASPPPGVVLASMTPVAHTEPVSAILAYRTSPNGGGTDIYMNCYYAADDQQKDQLNLGLVVFTRDGTRTALKWWPTAPGEYKMIQAHASIALSDIDRIEVQMKGGVSLLVYQLT
jgi:hypothetical protein